MRCRRASRCCCTSIHATARNRRRSTTTWPHAWPSCMRCSASARRPRLRRVIAAAAPITCANLRPRNATRCSNRKSRRSLPPWTRGIRSTRRRARPPNSASPVRPLRGRMDAGRAAGRHRQQDRRLARRRRRAIALRRYVRAPHATRHGAVLSWRRFRRRLARQSALITAQLAADTGST